VGVKVFYATPIIYPMSLVLQKYAIGKYILLNPLGQIIQDLRYVLVTPQAQTTWQLLHGLIVVPILFTLLIAVVAVRYFSKESKSFAENV
jgi:ABC-2 type transport system permease protein